MEGKLGPKQGCRCPVRLPFFLPWIKMWHKSIFPSGLTTANWVNMFFFSIKASKSSRREDGSWSLGLHDKKQLYMQKPVFDNFADLCRFCRHQSFGQQLIWVWARCERPYTPKFATPGSTVLYVFWLTDNFCAILHQFRIGCILHKTISLCTKLHISACAALKRLNSGYVWTVCTRWNKVQTGSQTLHLVTFVRATALVNYLLKAIGA